MRRWLALLTVAVTVVALGACSGDGDEGAQTVDLTAAEYRFGGVRTEVRGGTVTINLRNDGKEAHEAQILQIKEGNTLQDAIKDMQPVVSENAAPIPGYIEANGGVAEIKPGQSASAKANIPEGGTYAFFCFLSQGDTGEEVGQGEPTTTSGQPPAEGAKATTSEQEAGGGDGRPHFALGMASEFTVTPGATSPLRAGAPSP